MMNHQEIMELYLCDDQLPMDEKVNPGAAALGTPRGKSSMQADVSGGDLASAPVQDLVKALLAGGLTTTIQEIAKQQAALVVGDVSEAIAATSRHSEVLGGGRESGRLKRHSLMLGHEEVDWFDPDDPDTNIEHWLRKIDHLGMIRGWTNYERATLAQANLAGTARRWFYQLEDNDLTWDEWKEKLRATFPRRMDYADMLEDMIGRHKLTDESMTTYYHAKLALCHRVRITGKDAVSCIIKGLPTELRANARAVRCPTPEILYNSFLAGLESCHGESAPRRMASRMQVPERQASIPQQGTSTARGLKRCYNCQRFTDHVSRDCPRPAADRCRSCGKVGHKASNCLKRRVQGGSGNGATRPAKVFFTV
ncbi:uncharacterized protein LOC108909267 [Anoplophora glabripennis]|uniref:uncharacterized protein LOC108909267 n=1 Tax=Anoplophora glabripennis TaxID=217634 RepID=UPI0008741205|nr:uncharacterized protein LOC108909267 [Anoplophora glabripennis]